MSELMELAELVLSQGTLLKALDSGTEAEITEARMLLLVKQKAVDRMFSARQPKRRSGPRNG